MHVRKIPGSGFFKSILRGDIYGFLFLLRVSFENLWVVGKYGKHETSEEELWITSKKGDRLFCHIHRAVGKNIWPGIVLVPAGLEGGFIFDQWFSLNLRAEDMAAQGYAVIHFDPAGRGRSGGVEDFGGEEHQENLATVFNHFSSLPYVDSDNMGIASFSLGITMAAGALVGCTPRIRAKYLFDWEGPSNKYEITMNDTIEFFQEYPVSDDHFWSQRQACNSIEKIGCGYFRYQSWRDHVQRGYKGHAIALLNAALKGNAEWVKCNDYELNHDLKENSLEKKFWVSPWVNQKLKMIQYINKLRER